MLDTSIVRKSFTRASNLYEENAYLQRRIGAKLLNDIKAKNKKVNEILDIGMGTGWMAQELSSFYQVKVFGIDSAFGMVEFSKKRGIGAVQAEAGNLPFKDKTFDLVISNLTYQWVNDLFRAFSEVNRVLRPGFGFHFSCFVQDTLKELKRSFNSVGKRDFFYAFELPDKDKVKAALGNSGFKDISIENKRYYEYFNDLFSLLHWLKAIGANRLRRPGFMKRDLVFKVADYYQNNFRENGKIFATFDVVEVHTKK